MIETATNKTNEKLRKISKRIFGPAVLGLLIALDPFFIPDMISTALLWVCVPLLLLDAAIRIKIVIDIMKSPEVAEEIRVQREAEKKKELYFPTALYLVSVLVVALGLCFVFLVPQGYRSYEAQSEAENWPQTAGEVILSEVVEQDRYRDPKEKELVQPKVVTQYTVNGITYKTRDIHFNQSRTWSTDYGQATKITNQYPTGTEVPVYYNPENPSQAVLKTSYDWFTFFIMGLGGLFVILGIYWFWISLRDTYRYFSNMIYKSRA